MSSKLVKYLPFLAVILPPQRIFNLLFKINQIHRCAPKSDLIGRFYTKDALSVWTNLGKCFVVRLGYASLV